MLRHWRCSLTKRAPPIPFHGDPPRKFQDLLRVDCVRTNAVSELLYAGYIATWACAGTVTVNGAMDRFNHCGVTRHGEVVIRTPDHN